MGRRRKRGLCRTYHGFASPASVMLGRRRRSQAFGRGVVEDDDVVVSSTAAVEVDDDNERE